ncbi:MAG: ribonuclease HII [Anaerolineales bacterium]|nr:ribonuclease HII [Anaerolineales bacterium]
MPRQKFDPGLIPSYPDLSFEAELWERGIQWVAGVDEAGRGALAGPVAAAAVILPPHQEIQAELSGVRDSKQMTAKEREHWAECVRRAAITHAVGFASHQEIDTLGIVPATRLAVHRALEALTVRPEHLLVDFLRLPEEAIPQSAIIKGDARCLSVAAASLLAKTARDAVMRQLDGDYPGYRFAAHKGYGTQEHRHAIERFGACPIHRRSFTLIKVQDD